MKIPSNDTISLFYFKDYKFDKKKYQFMINKKVKNL